MRSPVRRRVTSASSTSRHGPSVAAIAAALLLAPALVRAQRSVSVDVGVSSLRQAGIPPTTVTTIGGEGAWARDGLSVAGNAIAARAPNDLWTGQAVAGATLYAGPVGGRWELGATFGAFSQSNALPSASAQFVVRHHTLVAGVADLFAGAGAAVTARDRRGVDAGLGQVGAAAPFAGGIVTTAFTYVDARRLIRAQVPPFGTYTEIDPVRYGDAIAFWQRDTRRLELSIGGGGRLLDAVRAPTVWGSASAAWRVRGSLSLVGAVGRALEDVVRGVPEARYASLSLRVPIGGGAAAEAPSDAVPRLFVARAGASGDDSTERVLTVRVRRATTVELMGDFTDWAAMPLTPARDGDGWAMECAIVPGAHRVAVRIDGGAWVVPANLPRVDDDFGGSVGLISVP